MGHKNNLADAGIISGSGVYVWLADSLPLVIGCLTVLLILGRIVLVAQDIIQKWKDKC